jgi:hypothetical protein
MTKVQASTSCEAARDTGQARSAKVLRFIANVGLPYKKYRARTFGMRTEESR